MPFDGSKFDEHDGEPRPQATSRESATLKLWIIGCIAVVMSFAAAIVMVALG